MPHFTKSLLFRRVSQAVACYVVYKVIVRRWLDRKPALEYQSTSVLARLLVKRCRSLQEYIPTPYLLSGLIQTLSGEARGPNLGVVQTTITRQVITIDPYDKPPGMFCCPDKIPSGEISVDWILPAGVEFGCDDDTSPVVVLVPGLTGSSDATYIKTIAAKLCSRGYRTACFNPRGRGGNPVDNPFLYSAGYTEDLRRAVLEVKNKVHPDTKLIAVGFSLGSNYLAKYVGEEGAKCLLSGAMCCACPTDCLSMSNHLEHSMVGSILMDPLLVSLVQRMRTEMEHVLHLHPNIDVDNVRKAAKMSEFDDAAIAPMFGFDCVSDYYRYSSCSLFMSKIKCPTMFVHAWNDPVVPGKYIRMDNFRVNPYLLECMTAEGGHSMIWPTGMGCDSWVGKLICEFVDTVDSEEFDQVLHQQRVKDATGAPAV